MATELEFVPKERGRGPSLPDVARLVTTLVMTLALLPYAWGRTLVMSMLEGKPDVRFGLLTLVGILAVIALTRGLGASFSRSWMNRVLVWGVAIPWLLEGAILVRMQNGATLPWPLVALWFIPATLWVVWLAWMFCCPFSLLTRVGVLVVLLVALSFSLHFMRADGMDGDTRVNFTWAWNTTPVVLADADADPETVILNQLTERDYPQFLGPSRQAVIPGVRLARDWAATPPRLVWRRPVGAGWGAFAVVGNYAVTQEQRGPDECVICYRVADGACMWIHTDAANFTTSMGGPGPRATPTIANGRVYSVGATGLLNCLDGATGKPVWPTIDILQDNQGENIHHGVCGSPLVVDNLVIVSPTGADGICIVAYDREIGRRVWQCKSKQASYASPTVTEIDGVKQVLLHHSEGVVGCELTTGKVLWDCEWTNAERVNVSQPIVHASSPGQVFVTTAYGKGSAMFGVKRSPDEQWQVEKLWESRRMKTKFTTAVLHQGYVYGLDDGILQCVDPVKNKEMWKDGRYGHGQILLVGDLLLVQAERGDIVLVEPAPDGLRELGRIPALSSKTWNHPALAGKYLLVRNDREAACYELPFEKD
jgi:outer membrane protein assembly factor BamB